jgi:hypothetical protein
MPVVARKTPKKCMFLQLRVFKSYPRLTRVFTIAYRDRAPLFVSRERFEESGSRRKISAGDCRVEDRAPDLSRAHFQIRERMMAGDKMACPTRA